MGPRAGVIQQAVAGRGGRNTDFRSEHASDACRHRQASFPPYGSRRLRPENLERRTFDAQRAQTPHPARVQRATLSRKWRGSEPSITYRIRQSSPSPPAGEGGRASARPDEGAFHCVLSAELWASERVEFYVNASQSMRPVAMTISPANTNLSRRKSIMWASAAPAGSVASSTGAIRANPRRLT